MGRKAAARSPERGSLGHLPRTWRSERQIRGLRTSGRCLATPRIDLPGAPNRAEPQIPRKVRLFQRVPALVVFRRRGAGQGEAHAGDAAGGGREGRADDRHADAGHEELAPGEAHAIGVAVRWAGRHTRRFMRPRPPALARALPVAGGFVFPPSACRGRRPDRARRARFSLVCRQLARRPLWDPRRATFSGELG